MKKMKHFVMSVAAIAAVFVMTSCGESEEPTGLENLKPYVPIELTRAESDVAQKSNKFAWELFAKVALNTNDNVVVSPASASFALSMLANGAVEETRSEILAALDFADLDIADVNAYNKKLNNQLVDLDNSATLRIGNGLFVRESRIYDSFITLMQEEYNAEVYTFTSVSEGVSQIGEWCNKHTGGLLGSPVSSLNENTKGVVANALYFEGKWKNPFYKSETGKIQFNNANGGRRMVDFMNKKAMMSIAGNDLFTLVSLPFGNEAFSFTAILPDEGKSVDECVNWLRENSLYDMLGNLTEKRIHLSIPKFEEKSVRVNLIPVLQSMGINRLFVDIACQLDNMTDRGNGVSVDDLTQLNYFKIDENGAKAASVTTSKVHGTTANIEFVDRLVFDRPFVYLISEKSTGAVLFIGKVENL